MTSMADAPDGAFTGTGELARRADAPPNYLGKLLQVMARAGLVESRKGLGGGFRLARDPKTITLFDVLDPIENFSNLESCLLGDKICSDEHACQVHQRWGDVRQRYLGLLNETSLVDLIPDHAEK